MKAKSPSQIEKFFNYKFKSKDLLLAALTHRSYSFENKGCVFDNQRLEFFGDAVIQLIVTEYVYQLYSDLDEGYLTKIRSSMTREEALFELAKSMSLGDYILLGKGEEKSCGRLRPALLADAFEALIGAIFLDDGLEEARRCFLSLAKEIWEDPIKLVNALNPKGNLQELTQKFFATRPEYDIHAVNGPEHSPVYEVHVSIQNELFGIGKAGNRKRAEEIAAAAAIKTLQSQDKKTLPSEVQTNS